MAPLQLHLKFARGFAMVLLVLVGHPDLVASAGSELDSSRLLIQTHGPSALLEYLQAMRSARQSIEIETFVWKRDPVGELLLFEALAAARRGVRVRILMDAWGSEKLTVIQRVRLARAGVDVRRFNAGVTALLPRAHRKLLIVDDHRLIFGGRNLSESNFGVHFRFRRSDYSFEAAGDVALQARASFDEFWESSSSKAIESVVPHGEGAPSPASLSAQARELNRWLGDPERTRAPVSVPVGRLEFVTDEPSGVSRRYVRRLIRELDERGQDVILESPIFAIGPMVAPILRTLRERGVPLRLLFSGPAGSSDPFFGALTLGRAIDERDLRQTGVETMLVLGGTPREALPLWPAPEQTTFNWASHCKSTIFNSRDAIIGSYNYDALSELHNLEFGVLATDSPELVAALKSAQRSRHLDRR